MIDNDSNLPRPYSESIQTPRNHHFITIITKMVNHLGKFAHHWLESSDLSFLAVQSTGESMESQKLIGATRVSWGPRLLT